MHAEIITIFPMKPSSQSYHVTINCKYGSILLDQISNNNFVVDSRMLQSISFKQHRTGG